MATIRAVNQYEKQSDGSYNVIGDRIGKIAGTFLAGIMGMSEWNTPFSVATKILRIYDEDVDNPSTRAGKYLEPVMLNYLDRSNRLPNTQANVLFPGYEDGYHADWRSHFEDDVFSGHVDAIAGHVFDAKAGIGIVENKTTTHPEQWDWVNNIPPTHYWLQASLYAYFLGYDTIYFTVGILTQDEVDNPYKFVPNEDNVRIMKVGLYPEFDEIVKIAREWYHNYIERGYTPLPDMKNPIDAKIVGLLDAQKSTLDEILPKFKEYVELNNEINAKQKQADALKEQICLFLDVNEVDGIGNGDIYYKYSEYSRKSVDTDAMKKSGIYDAYLKTTTYKQFKKGKP